jgi:hypothetical protein
VDKRSCSIAAPTTSFADNGRALSVSVVSAFGVANLAPLCLNSGVSSESVAAGVRADCDRARGRCLDADDGVDASRSVSFSPPGRPSSATSASADDASPRATRRVDVDVDGDGDGDGGRHRTRVTSRLVSSTVVL